MCRGLKFYTVCAGVLPSTKAHIGKCEPAFYFYKDGEELSAQTVIGVNAPELTSNIMAQLDAIGVAA